MSHATAEPNAWMILPFACLLAAMALGPLFFPNWWARHFDKVSYGLGAITLVYYLFGLRGYQTVTHTAVEYVSFIALIGSLYVVAGGIHIMVKGEATPWENVRFLAIGAALSNVLGTTGASMLLIRPWLRMNKYRITAHHVIFFIFIVSNVGGCLTPIGDPPLFLGYLKGIPFWWTLQNCSPMWLVGVGWLLATFLIVDYRNYWRAPRQVREALAEPPDEWRFEGRQNLIFLAIILGAVFVTKPFFVREALMLGAAAGSYWFTAKSIHEANRFNFHPVQEVAILFAGIFATMLPALDWLQIHSTRLGNPSPAFFYWSCGTLSSILDNAPTYLSFLRTIFGATVPPGIGEQVLTFLKSNGHNVASASSEIQQALASLKTYYGDAISPALQSPEQVEMASVLANSTSAKYLLAISIGSVFFGANTYIGNGPNFMVKAIADHNKVYTPSFLGYVFKFTLPYMMPTLGLIWLLFFYS